MIEKLHAYEHPLSDRTYVFWKGGHTVNLQSITKHKKTLGGQDGCKQ